MTAKVGILIPLMRPHRIADVVENIFTVSDDVHVHILATGDCFEASLPLISENVTAYDDGGGTWPMRMNLGYRLTTEPYFFLGSDDSLWHENWLAPLLATQEKVDGVVMPADLHNPAGTLALVSRRYIDEESGCIDIPGVVIYPGYGHCWSDDELRNTARLRGRFAYCAESIVEHLHHGAGKSEYDDTYRLADSWINQDMATHMSRGHLWSELWQQAS